MSANKAVLFEKVIEVRWSDCDANRHMRHTAYSDLCAHTRVCFLSHIGLGEAFTKEHNIGPVLFKEETEYKREVHMGERLTVSVEAGEATGFTKSIQMMQHLYKEDGELAATHRCVVAWMDLSLRKIVQLPEQIRSNFVV